jgi:GTP cyclohydrolase IA
MVNKIDNLMDNNTNQNELDESTDFIPNYQKVDNYNFTVVEKMADNYKSIIQDLGEDPTREGLEKTPMRVAKAMSFLTQGYNQSAVDILNSAKFTESYSEMVIVKDIELYSMCEHHMLPFFGKAHVAYIPNGYITGLSKLARVVDVFARRMQVQERMTHQVLDAVQEALNPLGAAVVIEAKHLCMMMRGVQKQNSSTTTSAFSGVFRNDEKTRKEFLHLVSSKLH